jgi:hypothetical protein
MAKKGMMGVFQNNKKIQTCGLPGALFAILGGHKANIPAAAADRNVNDRRARPLIIKPDTRKWAQPDAAGGLNFNYSGLGGHILAGFNKVGQIHAVSVIYDTPQACREATC